MKDGEKFIKYGKEVKRMYSCYCYITIYPKKIKSIKKNINLIV
jgi:hypothetical protein